MPYKFLKSLHGYSLSHFLQRTRKVMNTKVTIGEEGTFLSYNEPLDEYITRKGIIELLICFSTDSIEESKRNSTTDIWDFKNNKVLKYENSVWTENPLSLSDLTPDTFYLNSIVNNLYYYDGKQIYPIISSDYAIVTPNIIDPVNGSTHNYTNTFIETTELQVIGAGQEANPVSSQYQVSKTPDFDDVVINSGEIPYVSIYRLNKNLLELGTHYYVRARHKDMILDWSNWSEIVDFYISDGLVPEIEDMIIDYPDYIRQGNSYTIVISGAYTKDGSNVFYEIRNIPESLTISKTTDIQNNEVIEIHATNKLNDFVLNETITVVAVSSYGKESIEIPLDIEIEKLSLFEKLGKNTVHISFIEKISEYAIDDNTFNLNGDSIFPNKHSDEATNKLFEENGNTITLKY